MGPKNTFNCILKHFQVKLKYTPTLIGWRETVADEHNSFSKSVRPSCIRSNIQQIKIGKNCKMGELTLINDKAGIILNKFLGGSFILIFRLDAPFDVHKIDVHFGGGMGSAVRRECK